MSRGLRFKSEADMRAQLQRDRSLEAGSSLPALAQPSLLAGRVYELVLPMPPTVNEYERHFVLNGHVAVSHTDECKRFRGQVEFLVRKAFQFDPPLGERLELHLVLVFANRRRVDLDNRVKPLQDALKKGKCFHDDSQIDRLIVERELTDTGIELCRVRVREIA